jgi:hypothetical protein
VRKWLGKFLGLMAIAVRRNAAEKLKGKALRALPFIKLSGTYRPVRLADYSQLTRSAGRM